MANRNQRFCILKTGELEVPILPRVNFRTVAAATPTLDERLNDIQDSSSKVWKFLRLLQPTMGQPDQRGIRLQCRRSEH